MAIETLEFGGLGGLRGNSEFISDVDYNGNIGEIENQNPFVGGGGSTYTPTISNVIVFNVSSNKTNFTTLVNGSEVPNSKQFRISKLDLSREDKKIEITNIK